MTMLVLGPTEGEGHTQEVHTGHRDMVDLDKHIGSAQSRAPTEYVTETC